MASAAGDVILRATGSRVSFPGFLSAYSGGAGGSSGDGGDGSSGDSEGGATAAAAAVISTLHVRRAFAALLSLDGGPKADGSAGRTCARRMGWGEVLMGLAWQLF